MEDQRRAVLERVARGELSPTEAASLLEELEAGPAPERDPRDWAADWTEPASAPATADAPPQAGGAARIRIARTIGTADIIGDPSVREAVAEGPHVARREGDAIVIEGQDDFGVAGPGFQFGWAESRHRAHRAARRHHGPGFNWGDIYPLRVRVNPDLPLEIDAQAGKVRVRGMHGPIKANVQAGSVDIVDFRSTLELNVQAGSVSAQGRMDQGASRINCEMGGVRIRLERGSSVRVTAHSTMGKVSFDGDARSPWVVGGGEGSLDINATMGSVRVSAE